MALYRDEGVVLRTYKLGEADRIIVLFTRGRGKVRAVAKGVRRTRSKFGSRLEPGSIVQLQLYEGRNLDIVTQAERTEPLANLRSDLDSYGRSAILLEAIDHTANEGDANPALFKLLTGALRELDHSGNALVVPAFVAKLLALEGVQPRVDACVSCGTSDDLVTLQLHEGGVLCRRCGRGLGQPITPEARLALCAVLEGQVRHVLTTTSEPIARELEALASRMIEQHIERRLQSSAVLYEQLHS
ncbi:MAG: DNA repair protein RecO [Actinomycetia bacterium]|nr:DNA repair protein RecO [Actinomycetes bacterium]MCP4226036.1 DNA repair protein RecO [Actinomycetes bacterium]MCP5031237.1 DNA repair protein RecO [Actinomycetes bacterium]